MTELVFQPGIGKEWTTYADVGKGAPLQRLKPGTSLATLQTDYALFTYAPLFLYGGLEHNPVQEWINLFNRAQLVFILQLDTPIFRMNPPGESKMDSILWAVQRNYWPKLAMHIGSIGLLDRAKRRFTRVICQEIPVLDLPAIDKMTVVDTTPIVNVYTFGVDSNADCIVFEPAKNLLLARPTLKRIQPRVDTIRMAKALFAEEKDPYNGS